MRDFVVQLLGAPGVFKAAFAPSHNSCQPGGGEEFPSDPSSSFTPGCVAGHMNRVSTSAVACTTSVPCLVNLCFKGREKPRGQITGQVRKQFPLWLSQLSVVAPRNGFVLLC